MIINRKKLILIGKELNKISMIQNISKKKKLNDRFYNLKVKFERMNVGLRTGPHMAKIPIEKSIRIEKESLEKLRNKSQKI